MVSLFVDDPAIPEIQEMLKKYQHRSIMLAAAELVEKKEKGLPNSLFGKQTALKSAIIRFVEEYYEH